MNVTKYKEKKYEQFFLICFVGFTVLLVIHLRTAPRILFLNPVVPFIIYLIGTILGMQSFFFIRRYFFGVNETFRCYLTTLSIFVQNVFLSILVFGTLISWLFDFINGQFVKGKETEIEQCKVYRINISGSGTHNTINFYFKGKDKSINNFNSDGDLRKAAKEKRYNDYILVLEYKKGLLSSYIIQDWYFKII